MSLLSRLSSTAAERPCALMVTCRYCGARLAGLGEYEMHARRCGDLLPRSPFVRRALAHNLPAKDLTRR